MNKNIQDTMDALSNLLGYTTPDKSQDKTDNSVFARNRIFFGAPGTGKSYTLNKEKNDLLLGCEDNYERVTFHPDYMYANFVGSYRPVEADEDENGTKKITYQFVPGPFMRVLKKALIKDQRYLLIIEEINRANPAAAFGDVFQLLDRDSDGNSEYSISPSKEMIAYLKSKEDIDGSSLTDRDIKELRIPSNMFIWATMNSADQGVYPMDTAFKRRWDFEYIGINDGENSIKTIIQNANGEYYKWNDFRKELNNKLKECVNEDKLIGPFFIKQVIGEKVIKEDEELEKLNSTIKSKLIMYLFEDVARQKSIREKVFKNADATLSELFAAFDKDGIDIFGLDVEKKANPSGFDDTTKRDAEGESPADNSQADAQQQTSAEESGVNDETLSARGDE